MPRLNVRKINKHTRPAPYIFVVIFIIVGAALIVRTFAASDTSPPSQPQNLRTVSTTDTSISLAWDPSTDDMGLKEYVIYRNGTALPTVVAQSAAPSFTDTGLWPNSTSTYYVVAKDSAGNQSPASALLTAFTKPDTTPPSTPTNLTGNYNITDNTVSLSWNASTDNNKINYYDVWRSANGLLVKAGSNVKSTSFVDAATVQNTTVQYFVIAYDAFSNQSLQSSSVYIKTDAVAPTVPVGVKINGTSANSVAIAWSPSTDNIGVASYNVYRNGVKVGSRTVIQTTSYFDGNLNAATSYAYNVSAVDTSGLESPLSATVIGTTGGGTVVAPAPPSNLAVTKAGSIASLAWSPSSTSGIASYSIYRDGALLSSTTQTSFADTSVPTDKQVSYYVAAKTSVESAPSNIVTIYIDTLPPNLAISAPLDGATVSGSVSISATTSDDIALSRLEFYIDGNIVQSSSSKSFLWDTTKVINGGHTIMVKAFDTSGNASSVSQMVSTKNGDTQPPSVPTNLSSSNVAYNQATLSWVSSNDNTAVAGYYVVRNNVTIAQVVGTSYSDAILSPSTSYDYYVMAFDAAGNVSGPSTSLRVTTQQQPVQDSVSPSVPAISTIAAASSNQINLAWSASTDNTAVDHYDVYRRDANSAISLYNKVASVNTTSYGDSGLSAATKYFYYVVAVDASNNTSAGSSAKSISTKTEQVLATIAGKLTNSQTGSPLSGAAVSIYVAGRTKTYKTSSSGEYLISYGLNGTYRLTFSMRNYFTAFEDVVVSAGQSVRQDKALEPN